MNNSEVILLLGTNLGDRVAFLNEAVSEIAKRIGDVRLQSAIYESESWGYESQNNFLNIVLVINSIYSPVETLKRSKQIEIEMGRKKRKNTSAYEDRVIDIDILFYNSIIMKSESLTIPHKEMFNRRFVMTPLAELLPNRIHPVFKITMREMYLTTSDKSKVWKYEV